VVVVAVVEGVIVGQGGIETSLHPGLILDPHHVEDHHHLRGPTVTTHQNTVATSRDTMSLVHDGPTVIVVAGHLDHHQEAVIAVDHQFDEDPLPLLLEVAEIILESTEITHQTMVEIMVHQLHQDTPLPDMTDHTIGRHQVQVIDPHMTDLSMIDHPTTDPQGRHQGVNSHHH